MTRGPRRRTALRPTVLLVTAALVVAACGGSQDPEPAAGSDRCASPVPEALVPRIVRTIDHASDAYTQGLAFHGERLFESTGLVGRSTLRELDPDTGEVLRSTALDPEVFGEGLAVTADGELVQLTWKAEKAYVWDPETFRRTRELAYSGEGWGLTTLADGTLLMSDGSDTLVERDPGDFSTGESLRVERRGGLSDQLNELEWDGESLWANRYPTDEILRIDLSCGTVTGVLDVGTLSADARSAVSPGDPKLDVSNGIAHVPGTDRYLLTGKHWPRMYEITIAPA